MSLTFTQTLALIDRNCKSNSTSYPLADKTADINLALDNVWATIFKAGGRWQYDDSSHADYPIITTNLVSGQRDYAFVTDEQGNVILDIYKVVMAQPDGTFVDITPVDVQSEKDTVGFYDGLDTQGTPTKYDKTANAIFLDAIPNYSITNGLKVYINREGSYFTTADTTKKAGFAGLFHEYLALRPSYQYAYRNSLKNAPVLQNEMLKMEAAIKSHYGKRERDARQAMRPNVESTK
jgi:hypothetical protein